LFFFFFFFKTSKGACKPSRIGNLPLVGIIDSSKGNVFVVIKGSVELCVVAVVSELGM